ncbi:hypothetical protein AN963_08870 [Brevibacillus choshinensis]|uniref:Transcriptional regulator n=1 Tax=Brevibacillus choshinensis TaxID=54911 RepID=A0ABR5NFD1_BRECH|nr:hypothetical protein [Brevibacillus choshinensis]KQL50198.1 hypothetical protein AN963_08870 [Brevibacillus choshinensis]
MIRVGLVGPKDSVELMKGVGREFSDRIVLIPFTYQRAEEAATIVSENDKEVDIWFFSGIGPYSMAKQHLQKQKAFFPQINASVLTKVLLELVYRDGLTLDRVSFDTVSEVYFRETLEELGLKCEQPFLNPYQEFPFTHQWVAYHTSLIREGKVDACVTGMLSVAEELKRQGIKVYRMGFTRLTFREIYKQILQEGETLHFKRSQIAVQLIDVADVDRIIHEPANAYDLRRLDLKLQEIVLDYTESISGSFVALGNYKFIIFSTRGSFEDYPAFHPTNILEKIMLLTNSTANMGIGFGITALSAERNAQLALVHAKKHVNSAILVDHDGSIEGPLRQTKSISYEYWTEDKEISDGLKKAGVSITTLNKIISVQKALGQNYISASEMAEWMGMTPRNARRILSDLAEHRIIEQIGEETPTNRGRPRKIYRVLPSSSTTT